LTFLKKHYEKIILTILLLVFVGSLIYQITIVLSAGNITEEDLKLPPKRPDYRKIDFTKGEFRLIANLSKNDLWLKSGPRKEGDKFWTDFMLPFPASRSPFGKNKIIPRYYMAHEMNGPFMGKKLKAPNTKAPIESDIDKDGIPNTVEDTIGMDKLNPEDAEFDIDGDGFKNIDEYKMTLQNLLGKDAVNNPKIHPSLALRLYVIQIIKTRINVKLKRVGVKGKDKKNWEIHMETRNKKKWRSKFPKLGRSIQVDGVDYKIVDVVSKSEDVFDRSLKSKVKKDRSEIVLQQEGAPDKILVVVGEDVYAPKKKVLLKDVIDNKKYRVVVGASFKVGNTKVGREDFKVLSVDAKAKTVVLESKDGKKIKVTKEKMEKPLEPGENAGTRAAPGLPDDMMPGAPPRMPRGTNQRNPKRTAKPKFPWETPSIR